MYNILTSAEKENYVMAINSMWLCCLFIVSLYFCHSRHWKRKIVNPLFFVYLFAVLTLSGDFVWMIIDGKKELIWLNYLVNMISLGGCAFIGYSWLLHCFKSFPYKCCQKAWFKLIFAIPAIASVILVVLSPVCKKMFYIDSNGVYVRGPWFSMQSIGYIYVLTGALLAFISIKKSDLSVDKMNLRILSLAALPCVLIGGIQLFLPAGGLPYFQFSIFFSLCGIFVHDEERQITVDTLTKIKTRYEFERILNDKLKKMKSDDDKTLFLIAGDVDALKFINDNFGHNEGDVAICAVGDIMDHAASNHKAVAGRRSGDEFLIAAEGTDKSITDEIISEINENLRKFNSTKKYTLSLSFGVVAFNGKDNLRELVNKADRAMYVAKGRIIKKGRRG